MFAVPVKASREKVKKSCAPSESGYPYVEDDPRIKLLVLHRSSYRRCVGGGLLVDGGTLRLRGGPGGGRLGGRLHRLPQRLVRELIGRRRRGRVLHAQCAMPQLRPMERRGSSELQAS